MPDTVLTPRNYPLPEDWVERVRSWYRIEDPDRRLKRFRDLIGYPRFRRMCPGASGNAYRVPLAELASVDAGADPTEAEILEIERWKRELTSPFQLHPMLDLVVADGATAPTATNRLLLRAHRELLSAFVDVRLWWPRITDWRWHFVIMNGDGPQVERAFQTGDLPEDFFPAGRMR